MSEILLIENDNQSASTIKRMLETYEPKMGVQIVERLKDALVVLRNANEYRLIILDLGLEDARNLQGLKAIKAEFPSHPPIGIITGKGTGLRAEAYDEGAIFYLTKPFDSIALTHEVITDAITIWWVQYGLCRKAWESEQHEKLTVQMHEEAPIESPRLKRWQFWAGVVSAVVAAITAMGTFGKSFWQFVIELWQKLIK